MTKRKEGIARTPDQLPAGVPTRQKIQAQDRSLPGRVTGRLKRAIDAIVWQRLDRAEAAVQAGMTDHSLRTALAKPHVIRYLKEQLKVRRTAGLAKNLSALEDVRDQTDNQQARVAAVKVLHQLDEDEATTPGRVKTPGIVIMVQGQAQITTQYPQTGRKPLSENTYGPE